MSHLSSVELAQSDFGNSSLISSQFSTRFQNYDKEKLENILWAYYGVGM